MKLFKFRRDAALTAFGLSFLYFYYGKNHLAGTVTPLVRYNFKPLN